MEQRENKCLDYLRSESERITKSKSPDPNFILGWDDAENNFLGLKHLPGRGQVVRRTKTPVLKKVIQNIQKCPLFQHFTHRQTSTGLKNFKVFQDSGVFGHPVSQKRKEKIENSFKIFNNSSEKQEIFKKKHLIIQHILPDQCRVSGSFPNKFSFLKHPVKINSKKYFVIDPCL